MKDNSTQAVDNVVPINRGDGANQVPVSPMVTVTVSFGPNSQEFQFTKGTPVNRVVNDPFVREIIGFTGTESVMLNGRQVSPDQIMSPGDQIEFIKEAGRKA